ncbi:MAG: BspA family leucine-rich repeat surface protein [Spirochaetales bacterium]|nr:BspA family leucine-rich repeat surface protein [Spirochaetales bacterium]
MKKWTILILVFCAMFFFACSNDAPPEETEIPVESVLLEPETLALMDGDTYQLTATVSPGDATNTTVSWESDNGLVATVTQSGLVTAQGEGTATITVTTEDGDFQDTCTVTVTHIVQPFISVWDINYTGGSNTLHLPLAENGQYDFVVEWGDGGVSYIINATSATQHTYPVAGVYVVKITGVCDGFGFDTGGEGDMACLIDVLQWGDVKFHNNGGIFWNCTNLHDFSALDNPYFTGITDISYMFHGLDAFDGDISDWDVSGIHNMEGLFEYTTDFSGDVSDWDTSAVTDMDRLFAYSDNFSSDVSDWTTTAVTSMSEMFRGTDTFDSDVAGWNTSHVQYMSNMFRDTVAFSSVVTTWDTGSVTDMSGMFLHSGSFNGGVISGWDTANVTTMAGMFSQTSDADQDISAWDTGSLQNAQNMFTAAIGYNPDISLWDVSSLENAYEMFLAADTFNRDLTAWEVSSLTDMTGMFQSATLYDNGGNAAGLEDWADHLGTGLTMTDMFTDSAMEGAEPSWFVP